MDALGVISLVVGSAIGAAGILVGYRIAKQSGAFKRVKLDILLMSQSLTHEPQTNRVVFGGSVDDKAQVLCFLPFAVRNRGELSAKNVRLRLIFPLGVRASFDERAVFEEASLLGVYTKSDLRRNTFDNEGHRYVDYMFPEVPPNGFVGTEEPIQLSPFLTGIPLSVRAVSKNGVPLRVKGHLQTKATIVVAASAENVETISTQFDVEFWSARNKEELSKKLMEQETEALREELVQKYESKLPERKRKQFREEVVSQVFADSVRGRTIVVMPKLHTSEKSRKGSPSVYIEELEESSRWLISPPRNVELIPPYPWQK